ncbi:sigma-70 family RNA polymerase sigma factor [Singulisphaera sp. PoT]|uniref:sigma-70 family RNA polymerase sigma factor n=1 Tax=Singulisphaera sp. PoT TaxID=3411797 RepID=UPI003BF59C3F
MASVVMGTTLRQLRYILGAGSVAGMEDEALLARFSATKDEIAFEALMGRHGPMVLATCRAMLRNEHDAEDAFQATFLVLARKASSIRAGSSLAGWLHRVAHRTCVESSIRAARRRRKESEAKAQDSPGASRPVLEADHDWQPILHEEIGRLPESHRLPVVLCGLEGLTYEQAAEQLGWTVPKLRTRLSRAREQLKGRLTRRGVTALGVAAITMPLDASAAMARDVVSAALMRATISAVQGGAASSGATILAHTILRGMIMSKVQWGATATLVLLACAAVGAIATAGGRQGDEIAAAEVEPKQVQVKEATEPEKPAETIEVRGIVVSPEGQPVAGASLRGAYLLGEGASSESTSGADGRFIIRMPRPQLRVEGYGAKYPWLIGYKTGFGIGWAEGVLRDTPPAEVTLKLVPEGPSIEGRIVDLEGRPVEGAEVKLSALGFAETGRLAEWIARARNGAEGNLWQALNHLDLSKLYDIKAVTRQDGRFRLGGVGSERIANLMVVGPNVTTTLVHAMSREEPEIRLVDRAMIKPTPDIVHSPKFQLALQASRRVEGTIRDQDSGEPIEGIEVKAAVFDSSSLIPARGVESTTDANGHYRLDGLPRAEAYRIFLHPKKGRPYTRSTLRVGANSKIFEPVVFDPKLKKGIVVRGKVTNKVTGGPAVGMVSYFAFSDNPHLSAYPGFALGYEQSASFDPHGRYELIALPGRGLIAVRDENNAFLPAVGYEGIKGYDPKYEMFKTVPHTTSARGHAVIAEIDLAPGVKEITRDFQPDPGLALEIEVFGPDGEPVGETRVKGMSEGFGTAPIPQASAHFEIRALDPTKRRRVGLRWTPLSRPKNGDPSLLSNQAVVALSAR